jgi:hypothetical protein
MHTWLKPYQRKEELMFRIKLWLQADFKTTVSDLPTATNIVFAADHELRSHRHPHGSKVTT